MMKFPFSVIQSVNNTIANIWQSVYEPSKGTTSDKTIEESLWRRNQDEKNQIQSGWKSADDKRRKLFYYQYEYDLIKDENKEQHVVLTSAYFYISISLPHLEILKYKEILFLSASKGGWSIKQNSEYNWVGVYGDIMFEINIYNPTSLNDLDTIELPNSYSSIEIILKSSNFLVTPEIKKKPWNVLASGMRKKMNPGNPQITTNLVDILEYLPAQLEIGCGPAFEAGVPALHDLHYLYSINDPFTKHFILKPEDDKFLILLFESPELALNKGVSIFYKMITAPITSFYSSVATLHKSKYLVGPIITNNFDGIHLRLNIPEIFVRRYEDNQIVPSISFHPDAKSLLVVGCHADRRGIQEQAREKGLKVIVIDPEGWYIDEDFIKYPLEAQHDNDIIINGTAGETFTKLLTIIKEYDTL